MADLPKESADAVAHEFVVLSMCQIMCSVARQIFKKGVKQPNNYLSQLGLVSAARNRNLSYRQRFIFLSCQITLKVGWQGLI